MCALISPTFYGLIMAGGRGTRFWPESTSAKPKQYLNLISQNSLLTDTLNRLEGLIPREKRFITTIKDQRDLVMKSGENGVDKEGIIFEPSGRNTAPCILLGLYELLERGAKVSDCVAILPSDHVILNIEAFQKTLQTAFDISVGLKKIITIGITPNFPHTGFGYIQRAKENEWPDYGNEVYRVERFKEKPDFQTAKEYLKSGQYYWNAGMFVGTIEVFLREFEKHCPEIFQFGEDLKANLNNFVKLQEIYEKIPEKSIDYAIMEKSSEIIVLPAQFDWNDLGSWDALEQVIKKEKDNTIVSSRNSYLKNSCGNIIYAPDKFVALVDINDLIIVSNDSAVMILPKKQGQEVKNIVEYLKTQKDLADLL